MTYPCTTSQFPQETPLTQRVPEPRTSHGHTHALISPLYYTTPHSCDPPATSYHTQYVTCLLQSPREIELSLNTDPTISFWKIPRNPTFSVPSKPQSPTLLGSNLGTNPYVPRPLWNLLLSNSRLFSPGHTLNPRFLSLGNTCRTPVTRPPETSSRSNSPVYPQRGVLPHAGDYSTLTNVSKAAS
jgi:hypothetical protein